MDSEGIDQTVLLRWGPFSCGVKLCSSNCFLLTLKAPVTTAADDNFFNFFYFTEKTSLVISCESSAWQMIHMKCQDLFSLKKKKKKKN